MKKIIYIITFLALGFTSCTEKIDVDVPENEEKLVIEAVVSTEQDSSFVLLTKSIGFFSEQVIPAVSDAVVQVNGVTFNHTAEGKYVGPPGFTGQVNTFYTLSVTHNGKTYTSASMLDPMFAIDTVQPTYKEQIGPIDAGYTVTMYYTDNRSPVKYTYFRFGYKNAETNFRDSLNNNNVLFDNRNSKIGERVAFEIPFLRLDEGDTAVLIFRSCSKEVYNFYMADDQQGGGPFGTPPANLPTNIKGGALGMFATYDVKRFRVRITP